jgi:WD repeat-containing protein 35
MTSPITEDQLRNLILISRFSSPAKSVEEEERWIKKIPLMALIGRGVTTKVFTHYDMAPSLIDYKGDTVFANMSKEGEDDIKDLRRMGMVERLKLATKHHYYVSAYRITKAGMDLVKDADQSHHRVIDDLLRCDQCGGAVEVIIKSDNPFPEIWLPK